MSKKSCSDFELTLSDCKLDKLHIYYSLEQLCNAIIVSQERHTRCPLLPESEHAGFHFHCYLNTHSKWKYEALREVISVNLESDSAYEGSIHISTLRNKKHWIKYITKEDPCPAWRGVDTGDFHFSWKYNTYCTSNELFNGLDPFVRQNVQYSRIIRDSLNTLQEQRKVQSWSEHMVENKTVSYDEDIPWVQEVLQWWQTGTQNGLLIIGQTGVGKSLLIKQLLIESGKRHIRLPCTNRIFEFSEVTNDCEIAFADDINMSYIDDHRQILLQLLDGGPLSIDPKCGPIRSICFRGKIILCTNFDIVLDSALQRRIKVISAIQDGYLPTQT